MTNRTPIALEDKIQQISRPSAGNLVVLEISPDVACIFNLSLSGTSDIARNKGPMTAEAFHSVHVNLCQD